MTTISLPLNRIDYVTLMRDHPLESQHFYHFLDGCTVQELSSFQVPFYHAVRSFSQLLCHLGSLIKNPDIRLPVINNLYEEHGCGNTQNFHTATYEHYLSVLGATKEPHIHPCVEAWLNKLLDMKDAKILALHLGAIELIYTRVCNSICQCLTRLELLNAQDHYKKHEELDIEHGFDLLWCAESLHQEQNVDEDTSEWTYHYKDSMDAFIRLLNQLSPISLVQAQEYAKEPVSFYFGREDSNIELEALDKIKNDGDPNSPLKVLIVCSGGEHIFNLLKSFENITIVAFDINQHQLTLAKEKLHGTNILNTINREHLGKFEHLFNVLRAKLGPIEDLIYHPLKAHLISSACEHVFSNEVLETVFTSDATRYSSESFSKHFTKILSIQLQHLDNIDANMRNVLGMKKPSLEPIILGNNQSIFWHHGDLFSVFERQAFFDLISLSNIGDWMSQASFKEHISVARKHLTPNGKICIRRLLGDYDATELLVDPELVYDKTDFYSQTVIGR